MKTRRITDVQVCVAVRDSGTPWLAAVLDTPRQLLQHCTGQPLDACKHAVAALTMMACCAKTWAIAVQRSLKQVPHCCC